MRRISFDYDSTLEREDVQDIAKQCIAKGDEVWIITTRYSDIVKLKKWGWPDGNRDLHLVAECLDIPKERIIFTGMKDKWEFIANNGIDHHFDDDKVEIDLIKQFIPECGTTLI